LALAFVTSLTAVVLTDLSGGWSWVGVPLLAAVGLAAIELSRSLDRRAVILDVVKLSFFVFLWLPVALAVVIFGVYALG
jgi:hypothetical protein